MATGPIDEEEEEEMSYEILHCFLESYVVVQWQLKFKTLLDFVLLAHYN